MKKKVLVIGASENESRYSNMAIKMLLEYGYDTTAFGLRKGKVESIPITNEWDFKGKVFDTVTLYIGPQNQGDYLEKIIALNPNRVIFNPGTENNAFRKMLENAGIETLEACTLVMLRTRQF